MEMGSNVILKNQKLGVSDILRKALIIAAGNINFFVFIVVTSLPLFCFLVYYQPFQQKVQVEISEILKEPASVYFFEDFIFSWSYHEFPIKITPEWNKGFPGELIQLALLYLVPLHLLELGTALMIADLASKIYKEERQMSLKEMVQNQPFDKTRLKAAFITSVYVLVLSTCTELLGFIWSAASYYFVFRGYMEPRRSVWQHI